VDGTVTIEKPAHAGVHFPPPFVYAAGIIIGWLLGRAWPWPITRVPDSTAAMVRLVIAAVFAVAYLAIFLGALTAFRRAHTTLIPNKPATAFVTSGPYRWTRNPMYVSLALLYVAVALWMNSWWTVLMLIPVLFVISMAVIAREERYLGSAFPNEYADYCARTRRWL
jgi:protein-S-isoprenylcysteine O-methyltransferase Ste14